jgi:hypothetical protein
LDEAAPILNEIEEQTEDLRLDLQGSSVLREAKLPIIDLELLEPINHFLLRLSEHHQNIIFIARTSGVPQDHRQAGMT